MEHVLPVKIECRACLGDGYVRIGYSRPMKVQCGVCNGVKHLWIDPKEVHHSDVILKR